MKVTRKTLVHDLADALEEDFDIRLNIVNNRTELYKLVVHTSGYISALERKIMELEEVVREQKQSLNFLRARVK